MARKKIALRCYHPECANDPLTEIVINIAESEEKIETDPPDPSSQNKTKQKLVYCLRGHANILNIPERWDVIPAIL